ncbi:hypothetical protein ACCC96_07720 [Pseudomonas sp. Pseusp11]|uniref:hypothetical protein n=1 Tax=Pseudomonas sp. Pseusp11 TaxID=3243003 RepID=UPI0039B509AE
MFFVLAIQAPATSQSQIPFRRFSPEEPSLESEGHPEGVQYEIAALPHQQLLVTWLSEGIVARTWKVGLTSSAPIVIGKRAVEQHACTPIGETTPMAI